VIAAIARVTFRGLVARRRAVLMILLAALPIAIGLLARVRGLADPVETTIGTVELLIVRTILPLEALVFGTMAIGAELEDGTAIHLLTKPVARWRIVAGKLLAAAPTTMVLMGVSTLVTGLAIGGEQGTAAVTLALTIAVAVGALLYVVVFLALSILTSRALIVGLVYVVVWEGMLSGLFAGTQVFSVREYVMGIAGALDPSGTIAADAALGGPTAVVGAGLVVAAGFTVAVLRLERLELTGGDQA
jgi:ABC-2 type transport system permease protein